MSLNNFFTRPLLAFIPYYKGNTDAYRGRISYHGIVYDNVLLRYDQLAQRVVVLTPVEGVYSMPEQDHVDWLEIDGHRFVHDPDLGKKNAECENGSNCREMPWFA